MNPLSATKDGFEMQVGVNHLGLPRARIILNHAVFAAFRSFRAHSASDRTSEGSGSKSRRSSVVVSSLICRRSWF